jgi:hypothetical protein
MGHHIRLDGLEVKLFLSAGFLDLSWTANSTGAATSSTSKSRQRNLWEPRGIDLGNQLQGSTTNIPNDNTATDNVGSLGLVSSGATRRGVSSEGHQQAGGNPEESRQDNHGSLQNGHQPSA